MVLVLVLSTMLLWCGPGWAATMTSAQYDALGVYILNQSDLVAQMATGPADAAIADLLNLANVPDFWVWRVDVPPSEYVDALVGSEVVALTAGQARAFDWITGQQTRTLDASKTNVRTTMSAAFSANAPTTLSNLTTLGKRLATRGERVFATGVGSFTPNSSVGLLVVPGPFSTCDVTRALGRIC